MRLKFLWLKFILNFMGFKVVEVRVVDSSGQILRYTLNNDYNQQSGSYVNYPFLSISIDTTGIYSTQIHQDSPVIKNDVYTSQSPYELIKLWLTAFHHFKSTQKTKESLY
jgi:hypothetical protein